MDNQDALPAGVRTAADPPAEPSPASRSGVRLAVLVLFLVAFVIRLVLTLKLPGGLGGTVSDDAATYYAGADALVHGRLPYADFVLLHPPLLDLLLTPFAAFGALVGDHAGYMTAIVAGELLGAANAVLVVRVARRLGLGTAASLLGGLFYAIWFGTAGGERVVTLETVGNTALLLGLLALARGLTGGEQSRRATVLGGVALGAAVTAKITWAAPVVVIVVWWLAHRRTRSAAPRLIAGVVAAPVVVCGVFFAVAPRAMVRMVVIDQLDRPGQGSALDHARALAAVDTTWPGLSTSVRDVVLAVLVVLVLLVLGFAWRHRPARLVVVLAVVQVAVLVVSPSYFSHYAVYAGPALALAVAAAAAAYERPLDRVGRVVAALVVVLALVMTADQLADPRSVAPPFPRTAVATLISGTHCPTPDAPIVLIQTDQLSRTLTDGCPNWVDVTGRVYDVDRPKPGAGPSRVHNARWQRSLTTYLRSGDVVILTRPALGIGPELSRRIERLPLLFDADGIRIYRVTR